MTQQPDPQNPLEITDTPAAGGTTATSAATALVHEPDEPGMSAKLAGRRPYRRYPFLHASGKITETIPLRLEDAPSFLNFPGDATGVRYGEGLFVGCFAGRSTDEFQQILDRFNDQIGAEA